MYKVFVNDRVICFTNSIENCNKFSNALVLHFFLPNVSTFIVDLLFNDNKIEMVVVAVNDYEEAFTAFQTNFKIIKAAGGIVSNTNNEKLFIYRLNKWDLPKGKIENTESDKDAAIREIEEECGIADLSINKPLNDTFHIYKLNDKIILKQTYWFDITTNYSGDLVPQTAEGITKVQWMEDGQIADEVLKNTYASITELLTTSEF